MKLFVIAALIAVSYAGRLEHLERSYLPPTQGSNGFGPSSGSRAPFGSNSGSLGGNAGLGQPGFGGSGSFGGHSGSNGFGAAAGRNGLSNNNPGSAFPGATSNQYLPPDSGASASSGSPQFGGSLTGIGSQRYPSQQGQQYSAQPSGSLGGSQYQQYSAQPSSSFGSPQQPSIPRTTYGTPQFGSAPSTSSSSFGGSRYQPQQFGAASRQYLAPKNTPSFQNTPQQPFDEETGYHY